MIEEPPPDDEPLGLSLAIAGREAFTDAAPLVMEFGAAGCELRFKFLEALIQILKPPFIGDSHC